MSWGVLSALEPSPVSICVSVMGIALSDSSCMLEDHTTQAACCHPVSFKMSPWHFHTHSRCLWAQHGQSCFVFSMFKSCQVLWTLCHRYTKEKQNKMQPFTIESSLCSYYIFEGLAKTLQRPSSFWQIFMWGHQSVWRDIFSLWYEHQFFLFLSFFNIQHTFPCFT